MALCVVAGNVYLPSGELATSRAIVFRRAERAIKADYLGVVLPDDVHDKTNRDGEIEVSLITGVYDVYARGNCDYYMGRAIVPEADTANFADIFTAADPVPPLPEWLIAVTEARDQAVQAAEDAAESASTVAGMQDDIDLAVEVSGEADMKADEALEAVAELAAPPYRPFDSRGDAEAADIPEEIGNIWVGSLQYVLDPAGTALTTADGKNWSPAGYEGRPEHWGLLPGATDSSPVFQLMLDWCASDFNRSIVDRFIGARNFQSQLNTTGNVNWDLGVATYYQDHNGRFLNAIGNPDPQPSPLTSDYVIGSRVISAVLPYAPQRGDWVRIVSNALNPNDRSRLSNSTKYRVQEFVQVGVGSTTDSIVTERPLRFTEGVTSDETTLIPSYTTAMNARLVKFDTSKRFSMRGGRIEQTPGRTGTVHCVVVQSYYKPRVERTVFHRIFGSALFWTGTIYAETISCVFGDIADNEIEANQQGYGVCDGGEYTLVRDCQFAKCRHAYSSLRSALDDDTALVFSGGNTVGGRVVDSTAVGCNSRAFDTHHGSVGITFSGCAVEGGATSGFGGRGIDHVIDRCRSVMANGGFDCQVEATGNAGGSDKYATSFTVIDSDFSAIGQSFYARNSRVTVINSTFNSASTSIFRVVNSLVRVVGVVDVFASSQRGALPLVTPASDRWPLAVLTGSVSFGGYSELLIEYGSTLNIDMSEFASMPFSVVAIDLDKRIRQFGKIKVKMPDGVTLFSQTANRWVTSATAQLEVVLPSTGFAQGTAAGKFVAYNSDGVAIT